ncbi:MAG: uroporphyrinogen decarboxylase family protein [Candidatus Omnitrophota bacterium]
MEIPNKSKEEIAGIKKRITSFYERKPLDRLPFFFNIGKYEDFSLEKQAEGSGNSARAIKDHQFHLEEQIKGFQQKLSAKFKDDALFSLSPSAGVGTIASAFGCPTRFFEDKLPWTEHIIDDPKDIVHLKPDIKKASIFNLALEKALYFRDKVGPGFPISLPDIQGPVDTAGIVMQDTRLFEAVYTHPQEVHLLMKMVAETIISMVRTFEEKVTNIFCYSHGNWLPYGIHLSDDYLAVISPKIYAEFVVPYNEMIAREFGGVFLHSCGDYIHQAGNLLGTKGLMGVDFHEFPINKMAEKTGDKIVFVSGYVDDAYMNFSERAKSTKEEIIRRSRQDLEKLKDVKNKRIIFAGTCWEEERASEYYNKMVFYLTNI